MSTVAFALMPRNEKAAPSVSTYVAASAALVPAEVLSLHAVILSVTTQTDNATTKIIAAGTLSWAFWGLIILSVVFYVARAARKASAGLRQAS